MNNSEGDTISIALPSLIHRIGREAVKAAQTLALQQGCELKRVRRSRNWQLSGEARAVQALIVTLRGSPFEAHYLVNKLEAGLLPHADKLESLEAKLARLIAANPSVTLSELMQLTQCSIAQARLARFAAEIG